MGHHSSDEPINPDWLKKLKDDGDPAARKRETMRQLLDTTGFIGATGQFPGGKLVEHDEGQIQFRVSSLKGRVIIDFGKPVHSLGMSPQEACDIAASIVKFARAVARKKGESVAFSIL